MQPVMIDWSSADGTSPARAWAWGSVRAVSAGVWVPAPDWAYTKSIDASLYPGGVARVLCDLWAAAATPQPTITARLVSLTDVRDSNGFLIVDAEVGRSATIQASIPTDVVFSVVLTGNKRYLLQVTSDTPEWDLFVAPGAQITP